MTLSNNHEWPPVAGDFQVRDPSHCVAICTLGKQLDISGDFCIIGTCKTENIGIERVIINVISNPSIRFLLLTGPEVPGHLTGRTLRALHKNGVDPKTRKIIEAEGAIPYIENVPLEGIERFRQQVELIEMINTLNGQEIERKSVEIAKRNPGPFEEGAMWIEFKASSSGSRRQKLTSDIILLPEFGTAFDYASSLVTKSESHSILAEHPSLIVVEVRESDSGTLLIGKEG
ncbi:MAG: tetrahydromethanopterin S-methyltransferase subunit A [Candidatus Thorarchaeota archaeon]|nr:MAG: tetrahydromethanopterin S-methyltransferase subunit A [Candidatus Thorarchaeota archaeon]